MAYGRKYSRYSIKRTSRMYPSRRYRGRPGYRGRKAVYGGRRPTTNTRYVSKTRRVSTVRQRSFSRRQRVRSSVVPSRRSIALSAASALASSGTFTYANFSSRIDWTPGDQGWLSATGSTYINCIADFVPVITSAIARTVANTVQTPVTEPRFWIKKSVVSTTVTNNNQIDCDIICYPWVARYDNTSLDKIYTLIPSLEVGTGASTTSSANPETYGWTPFQSRAITESVRLLKPRRIHLQGGQTYTFRLVDRKPLYVNYARIGQDVELPTLQLCGFAGRSKGMFFITKGIVAHGTGEPIDINFTSGSVLLQTVKSYDWVACPMPYHWNDVVLDPDALAGGFPIIQPQTGAVQTAPSEA